MSGRRDVEVERRLRWFRKHRKIAAAVLGGVGALLAFLASVFPRVGPWLAGHHAYRVGGSVGLLALVALGWLYLAMDSSVAASKGRIKELENDLNSERGMCEDLRLELEKLRQLPSPYDLKLFAEWFALFPPGKGIRLVAQQFYDRQWTADFAHTIDTFLEEWRDRNFTNPVLREAFTLFFNASSDLSTWMGDYGHVSVATDDLIERPKPNWGGDKELQSYYEVGRQGRRLAAKMVAEAACLERIAHERLRV